MEKHNTHYSNFEEINPYKCFKIDLKVLNDTRVLHLSNIYEFIYIIMNVNLKNSVTNEEINGLSISIDKNKCDEITLENFINNELKDGFLLELSNKKMVNIFIRYQYTNGFGYGWDNEDDDDW
jgi:hypothetical protein